MERLSLRQKERWCHIFAGILLFFTGAMILSAYMIQIVWHLLKNEDPVFVLSRFIHYPIRFIKPILYGYQGKGYQDQDDDLFRAFVQRVSEDCPRLFSCRRRLDVY